MLKAETGGEKYGTSVTRALRTIVQQDGFLALYQGNFANVVRMIGRTSLCEFTCLC